jgi:apolipoprotein D and lipocalin family protein
MKMFSRMPDLMRTALVVLVCIGSAAVTIAAPGDALPTLDVNSYMGRWYQVALYPNKFQTQCIADTTASYRLLPNNTVEVTNECSTAMAKERVIGAARPRKAVIEGNQLKPASLEVAFAPSWVRWLPIVWGDYDVIGLLADNRIAIVSEPSQTFLWVLSRDITLSEKRWREVDAFLKQAGFELDRVKREVHRRAP